MIVLVLKCTFPVTMEKPINLYQTHKHNTLIIIKTNFFSHSGNKRKSGVEFRHQTPKIEWESPLSSLQSNNKKNTK